MVGSSHIIDVVLDVSRICRRPAWVDGGRQVVRGVLSKGLLASRGNSGPRVKGPRCGGCVMRIPQQVDIKGILHGERKKPQVDSAHVNSNTLEPSAAIKHH